MGCSSSSVAVAPQVPNRADSKPRDHGSPLDYKLGLKIGKGSYAQVHLATHRSRDAEMAVKIRYLHPASSLQKGDKDKVLKSSFNEVLVWKEIGTHENCVGLLDCFFDDHLAYMVMEKCNGSLFQFIRSHKMVSEKTFATAFGQILTGLDHMHSCGVIHRDIKPDNFLVGGKKNVAKICDFGLSTMMPESGFLTGVLGTAPYMPPEMLTVQTYDQKADVWSFGAVAYLLLCGTFPYQTPDGSSKGMKMSILKGEPADCRRSYLSDQASGFLGALLQRDPTKRNTAELAMFSPYITNADDRCEPYFHSVLEAAMKTGAFDSCDIKSTTDVDLTLDRLKQGELGENKSRGFTVDNVNDVISRTKTSKSSKKDNYMHLSESMEVSTTYGTSSSHSPSPYSSESPTKQDL